MQLMKQIQFIQEGSHKMRQDIADLKYQLDGKNEEYNQLADLFHGIKSEYDKIDNQKLQNKKDNTRELGIALEENKKLRI